ncbi:GNAT family N-acetyltransferase [Arenibacter sp. 6A1]|uniref:GNAT family N-acetyltransferase n=1 Tax=Arenibacter sp. 6A1 TaxID=2720391 RepID=UPI0014472C06|nr:GNAT family N-acetyltransferase [Arenibacter sp. 6A1]NKI25124.1 GNAT family N-acetyltransferase [Arenibacter sp. 6A1]
MNTTLTFRTAKPADKTFVAPLMIQAMEELALKFVNGKQTSDAVAVFEHFFAQPQNIYSYENTLVAEDHTGIVGSITAYDGGLFQQLRQSFTTYLKEHYNFSMALENETTEGEYYIDTISVAPNKQGLGIGKGLISTLIQHATKRGYHNIGLLVDVSNPNAKRLYEKLGFTTMGIKTLLGEAYEHMVYQVGA